MKWSSARDSITPPINPVWFVPKNGDFLLQNSETFRFGFFLKSLSEIPAEPSVPMANENNENV